MLEGGPPPTGGAGGADAVGGLGDEQHGPEAAPPREVELQPGSTVMGSIRDEIGLENIATAKFLWQTTEGDDTGIQMSPWMGDDGVPRLAAKFDIMVETTGGETIKFTGQWCTNVPIHSLDLAKYEDLTHQQKEQLQQANIERAAEHMLDIGMYFENLLKPPADREDQGITPAIIDQAANATFVSTNKIAKPDQTGYQTRFSTFSADEATWRPQTRLALDITESTSISASFLHTQYAFSQVKPGQPMPLRKYHVYENPDLADASATLKGFLENSKVNDSEESVEMMGSIIDEVDQITTAFAEHQARLQQFNDQFTPDLIAKMRAVEKARAEIPRQKEDDEGDDDAALAAKELLQKQYALHEALTALKEALPEGDPLQLPPDLKLAIDLVDKYENHQWVNQYETGFVAAKAQRKELGSWTQHMDLLQDVNKRDAATLEGELEDLPAPPPAQALQNASRIREIMSLETFAEAFLEADTRLDASTYEAFGFWFQWDQERNPSEFIAALEAIKSNIEQYGAIKPLSPELLELYTLLPGAIAAAAEHPDDERLQLNLREPEGWQLHPEYFSADIFGNAPLTADRVQALIVATEAFLPPETA